MKKILVVDDSALMRRFICDIISTDKDFQVVDQSSDGEDAYNKIMQNDYDAVVLDLILPGMTGVQVLSKLKASGRNAKVIAISSSLKEDADTTVRAMELGAYDFVVKPLSSNAETREAFQKKILSTLKRVVLEQYVSPKPEVIQSKKETNVPKSIAGSKLIALACSTGGPQALHKLMPMFPRDLEVPIVITQHMPAGFTASLAKRLDDLSEITVKEAEEGEVLMPGCAYIAPGGKHLQITEDSSHRYHCHLNDDDPVGTLKPCADIMYESLVHCSFDEILCVVLTGMGADGSEGIKLLKDYRNVYCISQSQESCVVYGMPKAVDKLGISNESKPLEMIKDSILKKLGV